MWVVCSVMVPRLAIYGAATKPRAPVGAHTRLCCSARAGIEVSSHDPLQNYTDMLFSLELFLGYLSLSLSRDQYVELDAIGLPSGVVQQLTFEEQVTNRNINRLQEGRQVTLLDVTVPVMTSII